MISIAFGEIASSFIDVFSWPTILYIIAGILLGIIIGAIPGIGPIIGIAILLPLTASLDGINVMILFVTMYLGGLYGGSISAILLNAPGTAGAAATTFDGYPMSRQGKAKNALAISSVSSGIGGILSVAILYLLVPVVTVIVLSFGSPEYFLVALLGIAMITVVADGAMLKGLVAGSFGLLLTTIGIAPMTANFRYPVHPLLYDGLSFIAVLIGLFALAEMFKLSGEGGSIAKDTDTNELGGSIIEGVKTVIYNPVTTIKSSLIGMGIGAIPGSGASVSNFVSYGEAMRSDKDSKSFGDGNPRGVIASEASNSATCAGSLIPTLSFGIPGSGTTAVLLGALLMHGIQPGPSLFSSDVEITYSFLAALVVGNLVIVLLGVSLITRFGVITKINVNYIIPVIIVVGLFGSLALRINPADVVTAMIFGILGYYFVKYNYSIIALVLGVVLGPIAEDNLYRSLQIADGSPMIFVSPSRPISLVISILIVLLLLFPFVKPMVKRLTQSTS